MIISALDSPVPVLSFSFTLLLVCGGAARWGDGRVVVGGGGAGVVVFSLRFTHEAGDDKSEQIC